MTLISLPAEATMTFDTSRSFPAKFSFSALYATLLSRKMSEPTPLGRTADHPNE
jgi:hypothetical protein